MAFILGERLRSNLASLYNRFLASESAVLITMALLVGLGGGLGSVVFRSLIKTFNFWSFEVLPKWLAFLGPYYVIIVPAIGGLFVGPMVYYLAREAKGHGVPEVMEAVALRGGRIRPIVVVVKSLASSICIGTGGSVGREGPIVQIGSALGSTLGQIFKLSDERIRNLVACGAAAGISATFNAPIAGVIFALEVILGEFSIGYFSTVVIASVMASIIGRIYFGNAPAFLIPPYAPAAPSELPLYILLGIIAGVVGVAFIRMLYWLEDLFAAWRFPEPFKPVLGGLVIGTMGLYFPQLFGVGYEVIGSALHNFLAPETMLFLCVLKIVATSVTIGSGGSGGVFAPSLFIGSMLGGTFGWAVYRWMPLKTALPGAYSLVGMAAVFSAAARAPITSILILFEMTQDYNIILPLMFATVVSTLVAGRLEPENIYTLKLKRRGVDVRARKDLNLMRAIMVEEAMTPISQFPTVNTELPLRELARIFQETFHHGLPVVDEKGELCGVVTLADLERAMETGLVGERVQDIYTKNVRTAFPDESLEDALRHFGALDVGRIPVVERANPKKLLGMLRRGDIIRAYSHALLESHARRSQWEKLQLEYAAGTRLAEVELSDSDAAVGKKLRELVLPHDSLIISIRRGGRVVVPRGDTLLLAGDLVVALTTENSQEKLRKCLSEG
ncbi:MAG: chloride channel protein [Anaerolineae bacterium]